MEHIVSFTDFLLPQVGLMDDQKSRTQCVYELQGTLASGLIASLDSCRLTAVSFKHVAQKPLQQKKSSRCIYDA